VRYEGKRGQVHGGFVAAGFDSVAVTAALLSGSAGGRKLRVRGRLVHRADAAVSAELDAVVIATS
jgi:acyl-coenzyme A thioesterase PaaI-like protein